MPKPLTSITKSATRRTALTLLVALAAIAATALFAAAAVQQGSPSNNGKGPAGNGSTNAGKAFTITGNLAAPLNLGGGGQPLVVSISNPNPQPLNVSELTVALASTSKTGCATTNFSVTQTALKATVPGNSTRTLAQLGVTAPRVTWVNRNVAQNACLGARLTFTYAGKGTLQ